MKAYCILCKKSLRRTVSRTHRLGIMYSLEDAREICDTMNRAQLYKGDWRYFLINEGGLEVYPAALKIGAGRAISGPNRPAIA